MSHLLEAQPSRRAQSRDAPAEILVTAAQMTTPSEVSPPIVGAPAPDPGPRPLDSELDVYGLTHPGKKRPNNEDHFLICVLQKRMEVYHTSLQDTSRLG